MNILGINAYHGDASACLVQDGKLVAAVEEERLNRIKHCAGLPHMAAAHCLKAGGIEFKDLDYIAISRDPYANLWNKIFYTISSSFSGGSLFKSRVSTMSRLRSIREDLAKALRIDGGIDHIKVAYVEHHLAHMASAFFVSPFDEAALLSIDGFGDFVSTKIGVGAKNKIDVIGQVCFPHSSGILYTATTQYLGFQKYGDEGKVMGLAPYGKPKYLEKFRDMVRWKGSYGFELNLDYFKHHDGSLKMSWLDGSPTIGRVFSDKFIEALGPARKPGGDLTPFHEDVAASLQAMLEEIYFRLVNYLHTETGLDQICMAGGVALNGVCNGKLFLKSNFKDLYIQPSAGDGGTALGAAFYVWNGLLGNERSFVMEHAYTGPSYSNDEIVAALKNAGLESEYLEEDVLCKRVAEIIADGKITGWYQGGAEFGPRALGNRSIVVDPRRPDMKDTLNRRIKQREPFRPFAPSIMEEHVGEYFEQSYPAPFMLKIYDIKPAMREKIPAVCHVDGSGRLQSVSEKQNQRYYRLIKAFYEKTGVPIVLNTSFNENEPIVTTPENAIHCFQKTSMDALVLGNHLVLR